MAWLLVAFDLPTETKEQRVSAARFRNELLKHGYTMLQFSLYVRPCASLARIESSAATVRPCAPKRGKIWMLSITDAQWKRTIIIEHCLPVTPAEQPEQMVFL